MKIGVFSEGHADRAVISNIITGVTALNEESIEALRPQYQYDETDKAKKDSIEFSTWSVVKEECEKRELIDGFLAIEGQDFVVIHLDTAEAEDYGVNRPKKPAEDYCSELRSRVIKQINLWFNKDLNDHVLYAIAIEETDAWLLTVFDTNDSTTSAKPKEKLRRILGKKGLDSISDYENYLKLSKPLSKPKAIRKGNFLNFNHSLNAFFEEVKTKVLPKIN